MENLAGLSPHQPLSKSDLSEIRLVKLYPGQFDQAPRCELEHFSLSEITHADSLTCYTAVSYTWGDPDNTTEILLNGVNFRVTLNLDSFLRHMQTILLAITTFVPSYLQQQGPYTLFLRDTLVHRMLADFNFPKDFPETSDASMEHYVQDQIESLREYLGADDFAPPQGNEPDGDFLYFWIDALCINQQDVEERNSQVLRMHDIYNRAPSLLIWLDDAASPVPNTKGAIDLVSELHSIIGSQKDGRTTALDEVFSKEFVRDRQEEITTLGRVLYQGWFSRAWIIQEVVMSMTSPTVLVHFRSIPWSVLVETAIPWEEQMQKRFDNYQIDGILARGSSIRLETLKGLRSLYMQFLKENEEKGPSDDETIAWRLSALLSCINRSLKSTDPRDLLYALLGLLASNVPQELLPDYGEPVEKVYHRYSLYLIKHTKQFDIHPCSRSQLEDVPSWVTDWRYTTKPAMRVHLHWEQEGIGRLKVSEDGKSLRVTGFECGKVKTVVHVPLIATELDQLLDEVESRISNRKDSRWSFESAFESGIGIFSQYCQLKKFCHERMQTEGIAMSTDTWQARWKRFWDPYITEEFSLLLEHIETTLALHVDDGRGGMMIIWFIELGRKMREVVQEGIGILESGHIITHCRKDIDIQADDIVCSINGLPSLGLLRPSGSCYLFLGHYAQISMSSEEIVQDAATQARRYTII